jgi:hypothetical protein
MATIGKLIFSTTNRDEAHRVLEYVLNHHLTFGRELDKGKDKDFPGAEQFASVTAPLAECREDNGKGVYEVWDGPEDPDARKKEAESNIIQVGLKDEETDRIVNRLADRILAKMEKK